MTYGAPDRVQSEDMPTGSSPSDMQSHLETNVPYEVWYYFQIEEGKEVVFADTDGMGDHRLVHATFDGETYSEFWADVLRSSIIDAD